MAQITSGSITYGRTVQPAQYESKKAEATFAFAVGEGESYEEIVAEAMALATGKVHEMVGLNAAKVTADAVAPKSRMGRPPNPANAARQPVVNEKEIAAAKMAAEAAAKKAAPVADELDDTPAISTGAERVDPAQAQAELNDDLDDILGAAEEVKPITDKDLTDQVTRVNAKIKNATAIRQLVAKFAGAPPKQMKDIPQNKRAEFLEALNGL